MSESPGTIIAKAPAKINLILRVGSPDVSGYHPLITFFQAVDIWDEVAITPATSDHLTVEGAVDVTGVPTGEKNIVWQAVDALTRATGSREPIAITITKAIPVAGGMAGGSADAAATLVALNELWQLGLTAQQLEEIAATIGADVPFSLRGGLALGEGRGDVLTTFTRQHPLHLVVVTSAFPLPTPLVYQTVDELRGVGVEALGPATEAEIIGVTGDDVGKLADVVTNDLQQATLRLAPTVQPVINAFDEAGAVVSLVSGSGPTVFGICSDAEHAKRVAAELSVKGLAVKHTVSTDRGAHLISSPSSPREDR